MGTVSYRPLIFSINIRPIAQIRRFCIGARNLTCSSRLQRFLQKRTPASSSPPELTDCFLSKKVLYQDNFDSVADAPEYSLSKI
jgi:hypothetical protein